MTRLVNAWQALAREQRLAALIALGLFVSMLLPWYSKTDTFVEHGSVKASQASLSAFQAFSFVEAAVLLVSAGVLAMLFARAEGREFQLPGGDGLIVTIAGGWASLLIFYRLLDKPSLQGTQKITATVGVEWGIFVALLLALGLLYIGRRLHAAERIQPPLSRSRERERERERDPDLERTTRLSDDDDDFVDSSRGGGDRREQVQAPGPAPRHPVQPPRRGSAADAGGEAPSQRGRSRYPPAPPARQMSFEDTPPGQD